MNPRQPITLDQRPDGSTIEIPKPENRITGKDPRSLLIEILSQSVAAILITTIVQRDTRRRL